VHFDVSLDLGWSAYVDGHRQAIDTLTPGGMEVSLGSGMHRIKFVYQTFAQYNYLVAPSSSFLLALEIFILVKKNEYGCRGGTLSHASTKNLSIR